jgi:2-methylcitrate dehydratase PrpD
VGRKSTLEGIGLAKRSAVSYAALANGIGIHADDYDDTQLSSAPDRVYGLLTHPTAPVLSSALAVAESRGLSGRELIVAYHPGVEVECKIAEAINPRHYEDGFHSTEGGGYDAGALTFGKPWTFLSPGISIKPFPSGSLTHPGMTALLKLIREHDVKPGQVERLDVSTNRNMPNALIHHKPADSLQAKFSMEFCMSSLLLYRRAGLNEFTDETVRRPEVQAMIARVQFVVSDIAEKADTTR